MKPLWEGHGGGNKRVGLYFKFFMILKCMTVRNVLEIVFAAALLLSRWSVLQRSQSGATLLTDVKWVRSTALRYKVVGVNKNPDRAIWRTTMDLATKKLWNWLQFCLTAGVDRCRVHRGRWRHRLRDGVRYQQPQPSAADQQGLSCHLGRVQPRLTHLGTQALGSHRQRLQAQVSAALGLSGLSAGLSHPPFVFLESRAVSRLLDECYHQWLVVTFQWSALAHFLPLSSVHCCQPFILRMLY